MIKTINDKKIMLSNKIKEIFKEFDFNLTKRQIIFHVLAEDYERQEILDFYCKKNWQSILKDKNNIFDYHLIYMEPKAILKFLPAFMLYCIEDPDNADLLVENLIDCLKTDRELKNLITIYLTLEQQIIIENFLEYILKYHWS